MITFNKDDDDSNIESYCVTNNAKHPRVCIRKKNKDTWVKMARLSPFVPLGLISAILAWFRLFWPRFGLSDTLFTHVFVLFFSHTHARLSRVVCHAIALNIGIIIIFIKCNHKLQCLIKKSRSCFSKWYFKFQFCYLLHKFTIIIINDQLAKTNQ